MTMLSDIDIIERCQGENPMVEPFIASPTREIGGRKVISYGVSAYGLDMRLGRDFKVFSNLRAAMVDPKNFDEQVFHEISINTSDGFGECIIPPNSFALGVTIEYFRIPRDIVGICLGKSTYARCGLIVNITPLEPEWEGYLTVEISNTSPLPAKVYAGEGIAQAIFLHNRHGDQLDRICRTSYKDKGGKYNMQTGLTGPRV